MLQTLADALDKEPAPAVDVTAEQPVQADADVTPEEIGRAHV